MGATMKRYIIPCFIFFVLTININAYSQSANEITVSQLIGFDLKPNQTGIMKILPKSEKQFQDNRHIFFVFNNTDYRSSADYAVQISWGSEESEEFIIKCGTKAHYFTGYGGGDVKIILNIINRDPLKEVKGATITVSQTGSVNNSERIQWK